MTAMSCLSKPMRRRRRNRPILESRLSKRCAAGSAETWTPIGINYLSLPLAFDFPWPLASPLSLIAALVLIAALAWPLL